MRSNFNCYELSYLTKIEFEITVFDPFAQYFNHFDCPSMIETHNGTTLE